MRRGRSRRNRRTASGSGRRGSCTGTSDHTSITYTSHGRDILIDGGHAGYKMDDWRSWAKSQFAHNEMTTPLSTAADTR